MQSATAGSMWHFGHAHNSHLRVYLQTTFLQEARTPNLTALVCIHYKILGMALLCLIVGAMHMSGTFMGKYPVPPNLLRNRVTHAVASLIQPLGLSSSDKNEMNAMRTLITCLLFIQILSALHYVWFSWFWSHFKMSKNIPMWLHDYLKTKINVVWNF